MIVYLKETIQLTVKPLEVIRNLVTQRGAE